MRNVKDRKHFTPKQATETKPNMRNTIAIIALIGGLTLAASPAGAFDSGSDGSYGPINITNNTVLPMPQNGIFNCTTITVASNATLTFLPNSLNTPVYLLAQGDIVINGTIDVSGQNGQTNGAYSAGGPGGFDGGSAPVSPRPAGYGRGPGGGPIATAGTYAGGCGSFGTAGFGGPPVYGNSLLVPLIGGSGGAGAGLSFAMSGGGGGGAVLLSSSSSVRIAGQVRASGGSGAYIGYYALNSVYSGGGSGGAIRIVAPVVTGTGVLDTSGGVGGNYTPGGSGRIRVDCPPQAVGFKMVGAVSSIGRSMFIFPPNNPRLYFVNAAGQPVDPSTLSAVNLNLPAASSTAQEFTVRGENFLGDVPVTAVAVPENGTGSTNTFVMHFPTDYFTNVSVSFTLTLATNQNTYINAYARYGVQP